MKLFQSDIFSKTAIRYQPLTSTPPIFVKILRQYFSKFKIERSFRLASNNVNSENYKLILKVGSSPRPFLLRQYKTAVNTRQAEFYLRFVEELNQRGVKTSPAIINLKQTRLTSQGHQHFALFDFLESEHWSPSRPSLTNTAKTIAQMHQASSVLEPIYGQKIKRFSQQNTFYYNHVKSYRQQDLLDLEQLIRPKKKKTIADQLYLEKLPHLLETARSINKLKQGLRTLPTGIIHSDLHPHNILMRDNQVQAIIDFDAMRVSQYTRDVAFAIYRLGRQFLVKKQPRLSAQQIPTLFLTTYEKIRPLCSEEKELLPYLMKDELLTKIIHVFRLIYIEKKHLWDQLVAGFILALDEVDQFWPKR